MDPKYLEAVEEDKKSKTTFSWFQGSAYTVRTPEKDEGPCKYCGSLVESANLEMLEGFCEECYDDCDIEERHAYVETLEVKTYPYGEKLKLAKAHLKTDRMKSGSMIYYRIAAQKPLFERFMRALSKADSGHVWVEEYEIMGEAYTNGPKRIKKELSFVIR
jgi:hypothetical protein